MPLYSFKNKKTGKIWDEILSFKERENLTFKLPQTLVKFSRNSITEQYKQKQY